MTDSTQRTYRAPEFVTRPVDAVARAIERLGAGDRAGLRRLDPAAPHHPAFWKLSTSVLADALPDVPALRTDAERRWATVLRAVAVARHAPGRRLGAALAGAEVNEARVVRLLRARDAQLEVAARTLTDQLAQGAAAFDVADLAWLILSEGRGDDEAARHQVARDYYAHARHED